jgi:hypothetical protein
MLQQSQNTKQEQMGDVGLGLQVFDLQVRELDIISL